MGDDLLATDLPVEEKELMSLVREWIKEFQEFRETVERNLTRLEHTVQRLEIEMNRERIARHEQMVSVTGKLAQRVAHLEGSLGRLGGSIDHQTDRMELWIERTVRVETLQEQQTPARKRKAI